MALSRRQDGWRFLMASSALDALGHVMAVVADMLMLGLVDDEIATVAVRDLGLLNRAVVDAVLAESQAA